MTRPWNGFHILASLILFFGIVFSVNGLFIFKAVTTFRGEDEPKSHLQASPNDIAGTSRHSGEARLESDDCGDAIWACGCARGSLAGRPQGFPDHEYGPDSVVQTS